MTKYKFNIGDRVCVRPRQPGWATTLPNYIDQMTEIESGIIMSRSTYGGYPMYFFSDYNWLEEWLYADTDILEKELFDI